MSGVSAEVLAVGGYAVVLLALGLGLDALAQLTHRRARAYRTAGFEYRSDHDHWVCPEGEHLWPHAYDHERRLVRYRARAHVCNGCPAKARCTDSDRGREIVHALDPWPHSEAGRFHRAIACVPVAVAGLLVIAEAVRHPDAADLAALAVAAALTVLTAARLRSDLRATPASFPEPSPSHGLRLGRPEGSRTRWGWER